MDREAQARQIQEHTPPKQNQQFQLQMRERESMRLFHTTLSVMIMDLTARNSQSSPAYTCSTAELPMLKKLWNTLA